MPTAAVAFIVHPVSRRRDVVLTFRRWFSQPTVTCSTTSFIAHNELSGRRALCQRGINLMFTRRTLLKRGGCAVLVATAPRFMRIASAQSTGYDFYISPTGSDSNPGTLASPWSITAINSHWSTYAGKSVGVLPGTYNVHSLCQAGSFNQPALSVNGGTASSPTLIQSTTPRAAILTGANPSGGGYPTVECGILGQGQYYKAPPNLGNVIIDGFLITRSYQYGLAFYLAGPSGMSGGTGLEGGATGLEVRNCEVFDIGGNDNDNVAAIYLQGYTGAWIHNNKLHSVQPATNGENPDDVAGIYSYYCHSNIYEYNTIYDCNNGIFDKYFPNGNHTWRYNYIESAGLSPQNAVHGGSGGQLSGDTQTIHNNIMLCPSANGWDGSLGASISTQSLLFYNNTMVFGSGNSGIFYPAAAPNAYITNYNNVYHLSSGSLGYGGILQLVANSIKHSNYNLYGAIAVSGSFLTLAPTSNIGMPSNSYTLSQGQSALGLDMNSKAVDPTFVNPTLSAKSLNPAGWALAGGTAGSASGSDPGRVGGVSGGAVCDMGAWGGASAPTQIGCNFGTALAVPNAPVLTVS